jgi:signal transduction histidine kinase
VIVVGETLMAEREEATIIRWGAGIAIVLGTAPPTVPSLSEALAFALEMFPRLGFLVAVSSVTRRLRENADRRNAELAHLRTEVVQSAERSRLSQEVHDGVGNTLAATVLRLEVTARALARSGGDEKTVALLQEEAQALREAMQSVRDWAFFTRPWSTGDEETPPSAQLTSGAMRLSRRVGLPVTVEGAEVLDTALESTRQVLLHLAQEALTNTAKHATGATGATVTVAREGSWIRLTVTDDGAGFDSETTVPGVGMQAMQEQARALHGDFMIESQPGSGTRVQVRLPG